MHFSIKGPELWDAEFATNLWRTSLNTKNWCTKLDGGVTKCGHVPYVTTEVISWSALFTTWWKNTMICLTARWKSTSVTTVTFRAAIHGLFKSIASAFMVRVVGFHYRPQRSFHRHLWFCSQGGGCFPACTGADPPGQTPPWLDTPCPVHAGIHPPPSPVHAGIQTPPCPVHTGILPPLPPGDHCTEWKVMTYLHFRIPIPIWTANQMATL